MTIEVVTLAIVAKSFIVIKPSTVVAKELNIAIILDFLALL
jgi:hypothetical protein